MNYQWHYDQLMITRKNRIPEKGKYYETHHILMKSLGGDNSPQNLIKLTAREHFIAHWLLWKIHNNRQSALAFSMMKRGKKGIILTSRMYDEIRTALSVSQQGENNHMFGKTLSDYHKSQLLKAHLGRKLSVEAKERIAESKRNIERDEETKIKISNSHKGKKLSNETKKKLSELHKGNSYGLGYKHTNEAKLKISKANKNKIVSDKTKEKMSSSKIGKSRPEIGNSISEKLKGKKHTESHIENRKTALKKYWADVKSGKRKR